MKPHLSQFCETSLYECPRSLPPPPEQTPPGWCAGAQNLVHALAVRREQRGTRAAHRLEALGGGPCGRSPGPGGGGAVVELRLQPHRQRCIPPAARGVLVWCPRLQRSMLSPSEWGTLCRPRSPASMRACCSPRWMHPLQLSLAGSKPIKQAGPPAPGCFPRPCWPSAQQSALSRQSWAQQRGSQRRVLAEAAQSWLACGRFRNRRRCHPLLSLRARAATLTLLHSLGHIRRCGLFLEQDAGPLCRSAAVRMEGQDGEAASACSNQQTPTCIILSCPFRIVVSIPSVVPAQKTVFRQPLSCHLPIYASGCGPLASCPHRLTCFVLAAVVL